MRSITELPERSQLSVAIFADNIKASEQDTVSIQGKEKRSIDKVTASHSNIAIYLVPSELSEILI